MTGAKTSRSAVSQACPNCGRQHDVSVYVSGQQLQCACGIRFEVSRGDVGGNRTVNGRGEPVSPEFAVTVASSRPRPSDHLRDDEEEEATVLSPHPTVPGYELIELLGKGGMGEVWRARQLSLGRLVALKLLPARFAKDREFISRFEKEANALAALSHPGIVQIIDRGQAGEHYYFTMELVPGINLREMMNAGRLPQRDALRIASQVARAIDYAHETKIVHRDLKPENVLVDARGHVKIADFGLAGMKGNERDIALTATAVAMGTVNYMAPEQRRDAKNVDHRADLYSLGVLVYELLTGELPIGRFKAPSQRAPGLDPAVDEPLLQLLETEPEARPPSARHLAETLEALAPTSALVPSSSPRAALAPPGTSSLTPASKGPWKAGALVLLALLALGVTLKFWPGPGGAVPSRAPAWYADSVDDEVFSALTVIDGGLVLGFEPAPERDGEELNLRSGQWSLQDGVLQAIQYGDATEGEVLRPRAYIAKRYYLADRLSLEVDVELGPLPPEFPPVVLVEEPHFAELAFRIRRTVVSAYAVPGEGMRLVWSYFDKADREVSGSSEDKVEALQKDAVRVPDGRFKLRLTMTPLKGGDVRVEAYANGRNFARETLPGFTGTVGKVAVGCRNHTCRFDNLTVVGVEAKAPEAPGGR